MIRDLGDDDLLVEIELAHGASGVGKAIGAGQRAGTLLGMRVLFGAVDPCGECDICRRGGAPVCPSARRRTAPLPQRVIVAARWVVALANGLELAMPIAARVPGDITLAYTLYARSNLAPREPTVVVGSDDVAHLLAQILRVKGIEPTVVDPADRADDIYERTLATFAERAIGARPWRILVTSPAGIEVATKLAGPRAQLTIVPGADLPAVLAAREVTIITVAAPHPDLVVEVAAMCVKGELALP